MVSVEVPRVERDGNPPSVTINRPNVLFALHPPAHHRFARSFDLYAADPGPKVTIRSAAGERAFCLGADLEVRARTTVPTKERVR